MTYKTICYAMCGTALMSLVSISNLSYGVHLNSAFADDSSQVHPHKKATHKKHRKHKTKKHTKKSKTHEDDSDSQNDDKDSDNLKSNISNSDKRFNPAITTSDPLVHGSIPKGWNADVVGVGPKDDPEKHDNKSKASNTVVIDTTKTGIPNDQSAPKNLIPPTSKNRILIPLPPNMGLAGYQSGDKFIIVIDNKEPMDVSALHGDGVFSNVSLTTLPGFTMLTLPIPNTRRLYMSKQSNGWVLGDQMPPGVDYSDRAEINPTVKNGNILFPMRRSGRIIPINDPITNAPLLIGTTILDDGGMLSARKDSEYDIWPSVEGVVVATHKNNNIELVAAGNGDVLKKIDGSPLNDLSRATYASDVDLEWLGLKNLDPKKANERYKQALIDAADASPKNKFEKRIDAAKAALGASDFKNAMAIMSIALDDDPEEAIRPDIKFLFSAVAFLNHDYKNSESLMQEWPEDDIRATKLWKGLYMSQTGEDNNEASKLIARDYNRILNYPDSIKEILLPMASEQIARYGTPDQKSELQKMPNNLPAYAFDRAMVELGNGNKDEAIHIFENLSGSTDLPVMEKSLEAGISMSMNDNNLSPEQAEQQYASLLPDATLVDRDGALNLLRARADIKANNFSKALSALDAASQTHMEHKNPEVETLYNKALHEISNQISNNNQNNNLTKAEIIHDAALIESHINDMSDSPQKVEMLVTYGEALDKLGLSENATDNYQKAFGIANEPVQKAKVADKLANNLIERKMYDQAEKAIADSSSNQLTPEENLNRSRILARISADNGKPEVALMLLNAYSDPESSYIKAVIHENRQEWVDAVKELKNVVQGKITADGVLNTEQQVLALKIASDASRAGDTATLEWIKNLIGNRTFNGSDGQIFQLLVNGGNIGSN